MRTARVSPTIERKRNRTRGITVEASGLHLKIVESSRKKL